MSSFSIENLSTYEKQTLGRILEHYLNAIYEKYPLRFTTPAGMAQMQDYVNHYQRFMIKRETSPLWAIPLKVIPISAGSVQVVPADGAAIIDHQTVLPPENVT